MKAVDFISTQLDRPISVYATFSDPEPECCLMPMLDDIRFEDEDGAKVILSYEEHGLLCEEACGSYWNLVE